MLPQFSIVSDYSLQQSWIMILKRGDKGQRHGGHWHTTIICILLLHFQHIWPEFSYKPLFLPPPLCWESFVRYGNERYSQFLIILYNTPRLEVPLSMNLCCIDFKNMRSLIPSVLVEITLFRIFAFSRNDVALSRMTPTSLHQPLSPNHPGIHLSGLWRTKGEAPPCLYC